MFYTKYRPQKFSDIVRPNEAADALLKQVVTKKTVHAYLFVGPRGTGKTSTARVLAKALNCENPSKDGEPCDKCGHCEAIKNGSFIDLIEIDAASNRGIDDIRDLKDKIKLAPSYGKQKIYIIDEVHMLTPEAFNALLKTLEEPPKNTIFILCTTELHKVPDTIKSRCQVFKFKRASISQIVEKLDRIAENESIKVTKKDLEKIARASLGGFRDAETLFQQVFEGEINVDSLLGVSSKEKYIEFVANLIECNAAGALSIVNEVYEEGVDLNVWTGELLKYLREILLLKSGAAFEMTDITEEIMGEIKEQAAKTNLGWLIKAIDSLSKAQVSIKSSFIPQLPVELSIVDICSSCGGDFINTGVVNMPIKPLSPASSSLNSKSGSVDDSVVPKEDKKESKKDTSTSHKKDSTPNNVTLSDDLMASPIVEMSLIESKWQEMLEKSKDLNHSLNALLKSGRRVCVDGSFLILEVDFKFHKERLESPKNRKLVEDLFEEVFSAPVKIKCIVSENPQRKLKKGESGVLTDYNVEVPASNILESFDGGLPIL